MANSALNYGGTTSNSTAVSVPNASAFQSLTALCVEMYIYSSASTPQGYLFNYLQFTTGIHLYVNSSGNLAGNLNTSANSVGLTVGAISANKKHHVAFTWDGSTLRFYIDGTLSNSTASSGGNLGNPNTSMYIGNNGGTTNFLGTIDELRFSNIARYTSNFTPPTGGLVADANTIDLWHFDEGTGTTTTGANGNVGTLSGSPLPSWVVGLPASAPVARTLAQGLTFDGVQNYVSLGTLGNFGSSLGSGSYVKFDIRTTSTANGIFGVTNQFNPDDTGIFISFNDGSTGKILLFSRDSTGNQLNVRNSTPYNFYDGNKHTVILTLNSVAKTGTVTMDGTPQSVEYTSQATQSTFANFNLGFLIGTRNDLGSIDKYYPCTLYNFQIGTSSSTLYGNYQFLEGTGSTTADSSGNSNTGTLTGSPLPTWLTRNIAPTAGLTFDGSQNYVSLGTMGSFGSNLGNGVYCSFQIKTTATTLGEMGSGDNSSGAIIIQFNENNSGVNVSGNTGLYYRDSAGHVINGYALTNFNDGNLHAMIITANPSTKVITISIDGNSKSVTYGSQTAQTTYGNFSWNFILGARNYGSATPGNFLPCALYSFQIGTSSSTLYGNYQFLEGAGATTADSSGNGNTGTLTGTPIPMWITRRISYPGLTFDGIQNYVSLGTMGSFGSNLGNGFYCSLQIQTTSTTLGECGYGQSANANLTLGFNSNAENQSNHSICLTVRGNNGSYWRGSAASPSINFNDGNIHTVVFTSSGVSQNITISVDNVSQTITYSSSGTPTFTSNFSYPFCLGCRDYSGTVANFLSASLYNFQIGTSSSTLYGKYVFAEDSGTTTADSSGNSNTGTLTGSPLPSWTQRPVLASRTITNLN